MNIEAFIEHLKDSCKRLSAYAQLTTQSRGEDLSYHVGVEDGCANQLKADVKFLQDQLCGEAAPTIDVGAISAALREIVDQYAKQKRIVDCFSSFFEDCFFSSLNV